MESKKQSPIILTAKPRGLEVDVKLRRRTDNANWMLDYSDIHGVRHRPTLGAFSSAAKAETAARAYFADDNFIEDFMTAEERNADGATIAEVVDYYIDTYLVASGKAERTRTSAHAILTDFEAFAKSEKRVTRVADVNRALVDAWCVALAKVNAPKTIANKQMMLRAGFRAAADAGIIEADPVKKWNIPKVDAEEIHPLEPAELAALLDLTDEHEPVIAPVIKWIAYTGNRPSDAVALRWSQVSMKTRTVERRQQKTKRLAQYQLSDDAMRVLKGQKRAKNAAGRDFVFTDGYGDAISTNALYKRFTRMQETLKCARVVNVKDLRHTFGYIMANYAKCPLPVLQVLMGHSKVEMTMKYVRATDAAPYLSEYSKLIDD